MPQQTSGLRFDIYERVYLPENAIPIRELNEMELIPQISVIQQGEQAVLNGNLALFGTYTGEDEQQTEARITHYIPVEITLPINRIKNLNDIQVEIENFDVEVLTPKTLNVTGVLSLEGIETIHEAEPVRLKEEMWFSHRVEEPSPAPAAEAAPASPQAAAAHEEPPAPPPLQAADSGNEPLAAAAVNESPAEADGQAADGQKEWAEPETAETALEAESADIEEKQEIKIAFAGKPAEEEPEKIGVQSIMQMAQSGAAVHEASAPSQAEEGAESEAGEAAESAKDALEWKKRFLGSTHESFRKVRMVIVQKEDTIETIAERYKKNAREIMLYNRINEEYLQEGQIVYIP